MKAVCGDWALGGFVEPTGNLDAEDADSLRKWIDQAERALNLSFVQT
jgi:hypothetical protein